MIKLVATDIDGTLLEEGNHNLNPEFFETVLKLKEKGIMFAAASGRQYSSIRRLFQPIMNEMIFIAENGAYVVCRENDISEIEMNRADVTALIQDIRRLPGCHVSVSCKDAMYVETEDECFLNLLIHGYHNDVKVVKDVLAEDLKIIKVSIFKHSGVLDIADQVISRWNKKMRSTVSGHIWIDFMDFRADKGNAIQTIQKLMNIRKEETMVFGDNHNDLGMIASAGESYAVQNAREEVKKAAKHLADANIHNGVLKVIKTLL